MFTAAILVVWILFLVAVIGVFFGAPYLPILGAEQQRLLDELSLRPGSSLLDLGSGDGRLLIAAARRGIYATGYEISPLLWVLSVVRSWPMRHLVTVKLGNFWHLDWPDSDVIYVFLITRYMPQLEAELAKRVLTPTLVASHGFALPSKKVWKKLGATYLYRYP